MAQNLGRARSLRGFVDEIAASKVVPAGLVGTLASMALMADWIDPLANAPWTEVDGVKDNSPHGSL